VPRARCGTSWQSREGIMTRIITSATIMRPIEAVYDYVTTPGHWPEWHPSSLGVTGATDHSLQVGEQVTERFLVAGRRGEVVWAVRERDAPRWWVIEGTITSAGGGGGTVSYQLVPLEGVTQFTREFSYPLPNVVYMLLDALVVRRRVTAESAEAIRRLKQRLESPL
jgi:uncharacterized protein YndB with AHSA1/START domain